MTDKREHIKFDIGADVYWHDPDDDKCSGRYTVVAINTESAEYLLINSAGSETEALQQELIHYKEGE